MEMMERVVIQETTVVIQLRRVPKPGGLVQLIHGGPGLDELKPERVQEWLLAFPAWQLASKGRTIRRTREFSSCELAAHYGAFVAGMARSLALPVRVSLAGGEVTLALYSAIEQGRYKPLTQAVLDFAAQLG